MLALVYALSIATTFFCSAAFAAPGQLDKSFGKDGKILTDFFGQTDIASNLAIDNRGKVLIAGGATKTQITDHFALARYNPNGALDTSFDQDGKVTTSKIAESQFAKDEITGMGLQSDGKIVVCGRGYYGNEEGIILIRYNTNGSIDNTFGNNGSIISRDSLEKNYPLALTIDSKENILIAAAAFNKNEDSSSFALFRFNAHGAVDSAFGTNGKVNTKIARGNDVPRALKIDKAGKIVAAGFSGQSKFVVVRYHEDGRLDSEFGEAGVATIVFNANGTDTLHALVIQDDGKILIGGDVQVGSFGGLRMVDFGLARLMPDGQLDLAFNQTGKQITHFIEPAASTLGALAVQADGKIIAVGDASIAKALGVARYNYDGSLDQSFGDGGKQVIPFNNTAHFEAVALQQDGKIVVGGYVWNGKQYDIALARFEP